MKMLKENNKCLEKLAYEQENNIQKRIDKAIEVFGEKVTPNLDLKELEKVLNPNNQHQMKILYDFYDSNNEIPCDLIFEQLKFNKFIDLFDDRNDNNPLIICKKPYTDIYIKPIIDERR